MCKSLANADYHLVKLCVKNPVSGNWVYPFGQHELVGVWLQIILERHQTFFQSNYCINQHNELWYKTFKELDHLDRNGRASSSVQIIYKYTVNIVGSDPYWFQYRKKLTAQA